VITGEQITKYIHAREALVMHACRPSSYSFSCNKLSFKPKCFTDTPYSYCTPTPFLKEETCVKLPFGSFPFDPTALKKRTTLCFVLSS
jgi:hypothetical protein